MSNFTNYFKFLLLLLCIGLWSPAFAQPGNNDCANATGLTVGANETCNNTLGTNVDATASGETPNPTCGSFGDGDDVWYSIVVPASGEVIVEMNSAGGPSDWAMAIYSSTCGSLATIECDDDDGPGLFPRIELSGETPGETLLVRVWEWGNNATGEFNICAFEPTPPPPAPANNDCATPTFLDASGVCTPVAGTNESATASGETPNPSCSSFGSGEDVWYSLTVPASGTVSVEMSTGGGPTDWGMSIYSGTCGSLTEIECDDDDGPGLFPLIELTGQTVGATLLVRVFEFGNNAIGAFNICAFETTPLPVELISFEGYTEKSSNMFMWQTATEENTEWHILERSIDGREGWTEVGREKAVGYSIETQNYMLEDKQPLSRAYYRLRSVDFDGYVDVSNIIYLERRTNAFDIISVFPNPTKSGLTVDFEVVEDETISLRLTDMLGQTIAVRDIDAYAGLNSTQFDMSKLANGVYFINISNGSEQITKRVLKN